MATRINKMNPVIDNVVQCDLGDSPCRLCLQTVTKKTGIQCTGSCKKWAHYKCLDYTPGKIADIKAGIIKVMCPCPDCETTQPKEYLTNPPYTCSNKLCPANKPLGLPYCPLTPPPCAKPPSCPNKERPKPQTCIPPPICSLPAPCPPIQEPQRCPPPPFPPEPRYPGNQQQDRCPANQQQDQCPANNQQQNRCPADWVQERRSTVGERYCPRCPEPPCVTAVKTVMPRFRQDVACSTPTNTGLKTSSYTLLTTSSSNDSNFGMGFKKYAQYKTPASDTTLKFNDPMTDNLRQMYKTMNKLTGQMKRLMTRIDSP